MEDNERSLFDTIVEKFKSAGVTINSNIESIKTKISNLEKKLESSDNRLIRWIPRATKAALAVLAIAAIWFSIKKSYSHYTQSDNIVPSVNSNPENNDNSIPTNNTSTIVDTITSNDDNSIPTNNTSTIVDTITSNDDNRFIEKLSAPELIDLKQTPGFKEQLSKMPGFFNQNANAFSRYIDHLIAQKSNVNYETLEKLKSGPEYIPSHIPGTTINGPNIGPNGSMITLHQSNDLYFLNKYIYCMDLITEVTNKLSNSKKDDMFYSNILDNINSKSKNLNSTIEERARHVSVDLLNDKEFIVFAKKNIPEALKVVKEISNAKDTNKQ